MALRRRKVATLSLVASLALFTIVAGFVFPSSALAWNDCPKGLVNDPYPGVCRRYVDTNRDDICDLSQPKPVDSTTSTTLAVTTATSGEPPTGDCPMGPCAGCGACLSIDSLVSASATVPNATASIAAVALAAASSDPVTTSTTSPTAGGPGGTTSPDASDTAAQSGGSSLVTHYNISAMAIAFLLVYAVSFFLYKTKRIKTSVHRKIWNVLLLATFLITGIFGLILTIQLDYQLPFTIPIDLLFWHVEVGVVMTLISLFHISWHFNYYRNLVRVGRKKAKAARGLETVRRAHERRLAWEVREARRVQREQRRINRPDDRRTGRRPSASPHPGFGSEV